MSLNDFQIWCCPEIIAQVAHWFGDKTYISIYDKSVFICTWAQFRHCGFREQIDDLTQVCDNSMAKALEILQSYTNIKGSIYQAIVKDNIPCISWLQLPISHFRICCLKLYICMPCRCGHRQAACREPAGSYDKTTRTAICFEHKTQYLLIRAPYTSIVVFWHISNIPPPPPPPPPPPMISQSQISCNTPTFYIAAIFVKYCYTTGSWLLQLMS